MPIIRTRNQPIAIERKALDSNLSLEALGLLVYLSADERQLHFATIQQTFPDYDVGAFLDELTDAGFIDSVRWEEEPAPKIFVYVVQVGNAFKVGVTGSLRRRVKQYKTHAPSPPVVIWKRRFHEPVAVEQRIHEQLEAFRSHGANGSIAVVRSLTECWLSMGQAKHKSSAF